MTRVREVAIRIMEAFEDLLDQFGIDIPNEERDAEKEDMTEEEIEEAGFTHLYGEEYYNLEDEITGILESISETPDTPKIDAITMKECGTVFEETTSYRMSVKASQLPFWVYLKAMDMDKDSNYLKDRKNQIFELTGLMTGKKLINRLRVVYFWEDYEVIATLDRKYDNAIFIAFEEFAVKYGDRVPNNSELGLGDAEFEDAIPEDLKEEWAEQ